MSVHWGGKGPGHVSRWPKAVGPVNTYSGATMLLDFLNPVLDPRITFSRGTGATRVNQSGFIETVGNTTPRFDYDPVTLAPRGLLIEEARTNLLTYSDDWSNAAWVKSTITVTANATVAPDGTTTADLLTQGGGGTAHSVTQTFTGTAAAYTFTTYVKKGTRRFAVLALTPSAAPNIADYAWFDLDTGARGSMGANLTASSITPAGSGWFRISVTKTLTAVSQFALITHSDADNNLSSSAAGATFVWGAQLEAGSFATSYIPTVASTVTRNADVATMTGTNFSSWYNQPAGTFVIGLTPRGVPTGGANIRFLEVNDGTATSRNPLMFASAVGAAFTQYRVAGADQANLGSSTSYYAANSTIAIGAAYATNDFATSFSGGAVQTDASGSVVTNASELDIGYARSGAGTEIFCGHIRTIAYFNTRLPNAQLQTLTAPSLATTLSLDFTSGSYNVGF